jgi:hypothetical protein
MKRNLAYCPRFPLASPSPFLKCYSSGRAGILNRAHGRGRGHQRANLDGSGLTTLVSGINGPRATTFDFPGGKMYLSEGLGGQEGFISRYNLDGSGRETFLRGLSGPTVMGPLRVLSWMSRIKLVATPLTRCYYPGIG